MNWLDLGYFFFLLVTFPLWVRLIFKRDYRSLLRNRLHPELVPGEIKTLWFHAVSVGEVKSLKNLIRQLESNHHPVVLSVTTPSGLRYARKAFPRQRVICAPLDFSFVIRRFLKAVNPCILVLNELEIWPNWLSKTKKKGIPILLINGRISRNAFKKYRRWRVLLKRPFRCIDSCILQSDIYRKRFAFLGIPDSRIRVCGSIKADEAWALLKTLPREEEILQRLKTSRPGKKLVVCASTHPGDEAVIIPALPSLLKDFAFILVPRHPDRLPKIRKSLEQQGIPHAAWSDSESIDLNERVMIFDHIGTLFHILSISDLVVMGGTFEPKIGGHNLYEPAVLGKPILGGPHHHNFPDIARDLAENGVYHRISDPLDFPGALTRLAALDSGQVKSRAIQCVRNQKGSTACILDHIHSLIGD